MVSKWRRQVAVASLVALGVAACGGGDDGDEFARANFEREESDETTTTVDQTEGIDLEGVDPDDVDDVIIEASLEEIEAFWGDEFATVSRGDFERVTGGFIPYGPNREVPSCGQPQTYEDIARNAFYCPLTDVIAWDTDNLTGTLLEQFGPFSLVIVMAHEYGHAVQFRGALDTSLPTIAFEQQADCFAGAFTGFVNDGGSDVLNVEVEDLDLAVAGFLELRDAPGTPTDDPNAHGSAFDRVGAFQDGFLNGTARCAEYEDIFLSGESTAIPLVFRTREDFQSGGNAPFDPAEQGNIFDLTLGSLETFWTQSLEEWDPLFLDDQVVAFSTDDPESLPECPGIDDLDVDDVAGQAFTCFGDPEDPSDDFIAFDIELAAGLYDQIGDFAVSGIISQQYAFVAQALLGIDDTSKAAFLQADCFSGAWAGEVTFATVNEGAQELLPDFDVNGEPQAVSVSAGDLDESVRSFLLLGEGVDPDEQGTAFERVAAFRDGFLSGLDGCEDYLDGGAPGEGDGLPQEDED